LFFLAGCGQQQALTNAGGAPQAAPDSGSVAPSDAPTAPTPDAASEAPPVAVASRPYRALAISVGVISVCAILENHRVKCWGQNSEGGLLGYGDKQDRGDDLREMGDNLPFVDLGTGRTAQSISVGEYSTCALLDDGGLKCWGEDFAGTSPGSNFIGDEPGEMGDNLAELPTPAGRTITRFAAAPRPPSPLATLDDDTAIGWQQGTSNLWPLQSTSPTKQIAIAGFQMVILHEDGTTALFPGADGSLKPTLPYGEPATAVAGAFSKGWCAVLASGAAHCSDSENFDASDASSKLVGIAMGAEGSERCGLFADGGVRCWVNPGGCSTTPGLSYWCDGTKNADHTTTVQLGQRATALAGGNNSIMCALLEDGSVKCFGGQEICVPIGPCTPTSTYMAPAKLDLSLGASVETKMVNGVRVYGDWHAVDLGTYRPAGP
jgi:Regulator of chromosome condensation (RCC1) repeat